MMNFGDFEGKWNKKNLSLERGFLAHCIETNPNYYLLKFLAVRK